MGPERKEQVLKRTKSAEPSENSAQPGGPTTGPADDSRGAAPGLLAFRVSLRISFIKW